MYRLILFRLSESYFRHRWLYLAPFVILSVFGVAYVLLSKPQYTAQGVLYVQNGTYLADLTAVKNTNTSLYITPAQLTTNEVSSLLQTDAFVRAVIQPTKLEAQMNGTQRDIEDMFQKTRENSWVQPMGDNQVLFASTNEDPQAAIQIVNGMIDGYIRWKSNSQMNESQVALNFFTSLIAQYKGELEQSTKAMSDYLDAHPDPVRGTRPALEQMEIDRLQSDINMAQTRYSNALEKEENARLSIAQISSDSKQTYMVIDAPHMPSKQATSRREQALKVGIFMVVGLMLSAGGVIGSALLDRTFHVPSDVEGRLDLPVLAVIPWEMGQTGKRKRAKKPAKAANALSEAAPLKPAVAQAVAQAIEPAAPEALEQPLMSASSAGEQANEEQGSRLPGARKTKKTAKQAGQDATDSTPPQRPAQSSAN